MNSDVSPAEGASELKHVLVHDTICSSSRQITNKMQQPVSRKARVMAVVEMKKPFVLPVLLD